MEGSCLRFHHSNKVSILQTLGVAVMPVLSLLAVNADRVRFSWIIRPALLFIALAILILAAIRKFSYSWKTTAVTSSLLLLVILQFGRIPPWVTSTLTTFFGPSYTGIQEKNHRILLTITFLVPIFLVFGIIVMIYKRPGWLQVVNLLTNIFVLSSIVTSLILIGQHALTAMQFDTERSPISSNTVQPTGDLTDLPDVYYLIMDAYGRADVLQDIYGYDNSEFLDFLDAQGCYVATQSIANYTKTILSLITSLNLDYVQNVIPESEPRRVPADVLSTYLNQNVVMQTFKQHGYKIVTFESGFSLTDITTDDYHLDTIIHGLNPFESILLSQSIVVYPAEISILFNRMAYGVSYRGHIARQEYILDTFPTLDVIPSPKFVFAHVILPHPPFVFQADGTVDLPDIPFSYFDADDYEGTLDEYQSGYVEQLQYLNTRLEEIIATILAKPGTPPVIILQADHGPRSTFTWENPSSQGIHETFSIFNTYCFPGRSYDSLYPGISPVNSFRVLFNLYFGTNNPLMPDESYYAHYWNSLDQLKRVENQ